MRISFTKQHTNNGSYGSLEDCFIHTIKSSFTCGLKYIILLRCSFKKKKEKNQGEVRTTLYSSISNNTRVCVWMFLLFNENLLFYVSLNNNSN